MYETHDAHPGAPGETCGSCGNAPRSDGLSSGQKAALAAAAVGAGALLFGGG